MRATLQASALDNALKAGVAASKSTLPILGFALIEAAGEAIDVTTYCVSMRARTRIAATVPEPGVVCADANTLRAAALGGGEIELRDGLVKRAKSRLKVATLSAQEWPAPDAIAWSSANIDVEKFRDALDAVSFACRRQDIRPHCRCVILAEGMCVATDGFRMSLADIEYAGPSMLIPIESVPHLRRRLAPGAIVEIGRAGSVPAFIAAGTAEDRIEVALEGHSGLPGFRNLIPIREPVAVAKVPRDWLRMEADRLAPFCPNGKNGSAANFSVSNVLRIESDDAESNGELTGELTGETKMKLNLAYLSDALAVSPDEYVSLEFHDQTLVVRDEARGISQVVMALRG
jgi:DNA polymerase III sliding clamp (beta) subunit (PCNA family)